MDADGPFDRYTLIYGRADEAAMLRTAAFPDLASATEHARERILRMGPDWVTVVVALGVDEAIQFVGAWNVHADGALSWEDASLA